MNGSRLKELRLQNRMSQEHVAIEMHVVRQTISKWERDLSSPSSDLLEKLSILLGASLDQLLGMKEGLASEHPVVSGLTEQSQPPKDNCLDVKRKEEMISGITSYLDGMNEVGVTFWHDLLMSIPVKERWMASTTKERIAELDAIEAQREQDAAQAKERAAKEAEEKATAKREQIYRDYAGMFNAIKKVKIPTRYDLSIGEIEAIDFVCGEISRCFPEYAYSVASKYFDYGFVKGMRYATARAKKK